jgi:hypothetical protein
LSGLRATVAAAWEETVMKKTAFLGSLALAFLAGAVAAQEPEPPVYDTQEDELLQWEQAAPGERVYPRRSIRVLGNPYELASFYRSSQGGFYDYRPEGGPSAERYPIAGYYRARSSSYRGYPVADAAGYAPFWNHGYSPAQPGIALHYRQRIGQNGELFLFAPTFLAPVGPLTGAFFFGFDR